MRSRESKIRCVINFLSWDVILMRCKHNGLRLTSRQAAPETPGGEINFACNFIIQGSYANLWTVTLSLPVFQ